jgi:histidine triad (HIT) family protein
LDEDTYAHLMVVTRQLAQHLQDILEPVRIGEMVEGFGVPHAHIHLIPINANFEVTLKEHWQNRQQLDSQEGERLQTLLKI